MQSVHSPVVLLDWWAGGRRLAHKGGKMDCQHEKMGKMLWDRSRSPDMDIRLPVAFVEYCVFCGTLLSYNNLKVKERTDGRVLQSVPQVRRSPDYGEVQDKV